MKTQLTSTVPTHYQRQSISAFGLPVKSNMGGYFSVNEKYSTKKDAQDYMLKIAENLAENEKELRIMRKSIKKQGLLYYDAAVLRLEKLEIEN